MKNKLNFGIVVVNSCTEQKRDTKLIEQISNN